MSLAAKREAYQQLVRERQACRLCENVLTNASAICEGRYDSDEIGAYTRWQGNLESRLVVVGQDFADEEGFVKYEGWPGGDVATNQTLADIFASSVEGQLSLPRKGEPADQYFFTNALLCMKSGGMQKSVPAKCFKNCGTFLRKTIDIVAPALVVTLGVRALEATKEAYGCSDARKLADCVGQTIQLSGQITLIPVYHPSPTVLRTHRKVEQMKQDWRAVGKALSR